MKLQKTIKWLFVSALVFMFSFISIIFIAAIVNLKAEEVAQEIQSDYIKEEMRPTIEHDDFQDVFYNEKEPPKDTEHEIQNPEYESFEEYVSLMTKQFHGESALKDVTTEDDFKYHLVVSSTNYLKYYNKIGVIPNELQKLVDDGIKVTNHFENSDNPNEYFNELKRVHNLLDEKIRH